MGTGETVITILMALFGGLNVFQFIFWRSTKLKQEAEAKKVDVEAKQADTDLMQDQYTFVVDKLSSTQREYYELADRIRETTRQHIEEIDEKCKEIAELKSKITYLKGLRCYRSDCAQRIKLNPDKQE